MTWTVLFHSDFEVEFDGFDLRVQEELAATIEVLEEEGPQLGRPLADTLNGSRYPNMKELRVSVGKEVWRAAFAFDPDREAIILVAGDKAGENQKRFYKRLIATADARFEMHLGELEQERKSRGRS